MAEVPQSAGELGGLLPIPAAYCGVVRVNQDPDGFLLVSGKLGVMDNGDGGSAVEWPTGVPDGEWETVSVHTLELPAEWPPGCRCVISDGERVSLGGPCPPHPDVRVATGG